MAGELVRIEWSYRTTYVAWVPLPDGVSAEEFDPGRYDMDEVEMALGDIDDDCHAVDGSWGEIEMTTEVPPRGVEVDEMAWDEMELEDRK